MDTLPQQSTSPHLNKTPNHKHIPLGQGGCPYLEIDVEDLSYEDYKNKKYKDCYYHEYLQLDKILDANRPRSAEFLPDGPSHDEHLFITIHQAYELWFKQILYEMDSCITFLGRHQLEDRELLKIVSRLQRINHILKLLVEQFSILDTMTPMNFLDFRKYLKPASGFQSVQFRILENKLGLPRSQRMRYNKQEYTKVLTAEHEELVTQNACNDSKTLFGVLQKWLERFPFLQSHDWDFWAHYKAAVNEYILEEKQLYLNNEESMDDPVRQKEIENALEASYQSHVQTFNCIFNQQKYEELREKGKVRLSYTSLQAALMIMLYREEPVLQMPFKVLQLCMDIDQHLTEWRNAHALMVHRMLGSKMGTGGSSGFHYLRTAAIHHKVFTDYFNLSTYMIPRSNLPRLPGSIKSFMKFPQSPRVATRHPLCRRKLTKELPPFPILEASNSGSDLLLQLAQSERKSPTKKSSIIHSLKEGDWRHLEKSVILESHEMDDKALVNGMQKLQVTTGKMSELSNSEPVTREQVAKLEDQIKQLTERRDYWRNQASIESKRNRANGAANEEQ